MIVRECVQNITYPLSTVKPLRANLLLNFYSIDSFMERFGEKLRTLRQRRGLTMRALAKELGFTTHGYLGDLESGRAKPSLELALTIADFFGVSVDLLARDEVELPGNDQITNLPQ